MVKVKRVTRTDRVTVWNAAIEERQGGVHEYSKRMDEEVSFPLWHLIWFTDWGTGTRRDFVAIRYVKGNSRRSTSRRAGPAGGWNWVGGAGESGRAWEHDRFVGAVSLGPLFLSFLLLFNAYIYIFSFLYAIYPESTALSNLTLPSSFANSSCSPRCTPLISTPLPNLWSTLPCPYSNRRFP